MELVDIGVNLTHARFGRDREAVIARAAEAGVGTLIATGIDVAGSEAAAALCREGPPRILATAGVHPHVASEWTPDTRDAIARLAGQPGVVAIGETGLDFNRDFSPRDAQERAFRAQLEIAVERRLPVFLHQRDAIDRFARVLAEYRHALVGGVAHCFTDGAEALAACRELDLHIGITGWLCDERRGDALRACVADIPADRLLVETDAPFLTPRDYRPKPRDGRNEPALLPHIVRTLAQYRAENAEQLADLTTANARRLFSL